jgi:hypothetical protein
MTWIHLINASTHTLVNSSSENKNEKTKEIKIMMTEINKRIFIVTLWEIFHLE